MPSIHAVTFSIQGWQLLEVKTYQKLWSNPQYQEYLSLSLFEQRPDFAANLSDIDALRQQSQQAVQPYNGSVTEIDNEVIDNMLMLRQIIKVALPSPKQGNVYLGTYTIPYQQFSYVIKVQCPEQDASHRRELMVMNQLVDDGQLQLSDIAGTSFDQMPASMRDLISQTADHKKYDTEFPDHALTRLRNHLLLLQKTIKLDPALQNAQPFSL